MDDREPCSRSNLGPEGGIKKVKAPKTKAAKPEVEKRLDEHGRTVRFKAKPTIKDLDRIGRALPGSSHRLFLIAREQLAPPGSDAGAKEEFSVLGNTGNVYQVHIGKHLNCTCPDFQKGNLCKHVLFVMLRVLKLDQSDHLVWQRALLRSEADDVLSGKRSKGGADAAVMASQAVQKHYKRHCGGAAAGEEDGAGPSSKPAEGDCPVCYDEFCATDKTVACTTCRNHIHEACMKIWVSQCKAKGNSVTCVLCRSDWTDPSGAGAAVDANGYLNLKSVSEAHRNAPEPADYYSGPAHGGFRSNGVFSPGRRRNWPVYDLDDD